jgi:hypothetical protein
VRFETSISLLLLFVTAVVLTLYAQAGAGFRGADGYSHGTTTCLQGTDGPGIRLTLRAHHNCEGWNVYPYLEVYVRELPVEVNRPIIIGETNWAFRCRSSKESCEQLPSGELMFNHFEQSNGNELPLTDGWYELKPNRGLSETGRFKVDCLAPCA